MSSSPALMPLSLYVCDPSNRSLPTGLDFVFWGTYAPEIKTHISIGKQHHISGKSCLKYKCLPRISNRLCLPRLSHRLVSAHNVLQTVCPACSTDQCLSSMPRRLVSATYDLQTAVCPECPTDYCLSMVPYKLVSAQRSHKLCAQMPQTNFCQRCLM